MILNDMPSCRKLTARLKLLAKIYHVCIGARENPEMEFLETEAIEHAFHAYT